MDGGCQWNPPVKECGAGMKGHSKEQGDKTDLEADEGHGVLPQRVLDDVQHLQSAYVHVVGGT